VTIAFAKEKGIEEGMEKGRKEGEKKETAGNRP
jgi:flagellar biosynthesis/type III secretory pathway protein FliH